MKNLSFGINLIECHCTQIVIVFLFVLLSISVNGAENGAISTDYNLNEKEFAITLRKLKTELDKLEERKKEGEDKWHKEIQSIYKKLSSMRTNCIRPRAKDVTIALYKGKALFLLEDLPASNKTLLRALKQSVFFRLDEKYTENNLNMKYLPSAEIYFWLSNIYLKYGENADIEQKKIEAYTTSYQILKMLLRNYKGFEKENDAKMYLTECGEFLKKANVNLNKIDVTDKTVSKIVPLESQTPKPIFLTPEEVKKAVREKRMPDKLKDQPN